MSGKARQAADARSRARVERLRNQEGPKQPVSDAAVDAMFARLACGE